MKPTFILKVEGVALPFFFAVPPLDFKVESGQDSQTYKIIDLGEKTIIGQRNAEKISFSTFLPNFKSQFFSLLNPLLPSTAINFLKKWKDEKKKMILIVPEYNLFFKCYLTQLNYEVVERTGDIDISLEFLEITKNKSLVDEVIGLFTR